ncbi:hypothetical protein [Muricoccus aerilatus]|uniref:hypothetical protein n=1 Tax=Muricoccus aerilatus TaxID=452982 RepID=UPI00147016B8|nr:hypothetical protein [Roseomonas aerilata]
MAQIGGKLLWANDGSGSAAGSAETSVNDAEWGIVLVLGPAGVEGLDATNGRLRFSPLTDPIPGNAADLKVLCEESSRIAGPARSREGLCSAAMGTSHLCCAAFCKMPRVSAAETEF